MEPSRRLFLGVLGILSLIGSALQAETPIPRSEIFGIRKSVLPKVTATFTPLPPNPFVLIAADTCGSIEVAPPADDASRAYYQEARFCPVDLPDGARVVRVTAFGLDFDESVDFLGSSWVPSSFASLGSFVNISLENRSIGSGVMETRTSYCQKDSGAANVFLGERSVTLNCPNREDVDPGLKDANSKIVLRMDTLANGPVTTASNFRRGIKHIVPFVKMIKVEYQPAP